MRRASWAILVIACVAFGGLAHADYLEVSRAAIVRAQPAGDASPIEQVSAGARLALLDEGQQQNGYYHVLASTGTRDGWIYRNRVRRKPGDLPAAPGAGAPGGGIYSTLCLDGCPAGAPADNDVIVREIYVLSNNATTKFADWVAYKITRYTIGPSKPRNWKEDPQLAPARTLSPPDYNGAHAALKVDRGHQAPLASFTATPYWEETNYLSNITPQRSALNQGPWKNLEDKVRALAKRPGVNEVFGMTGPLYERALPALPHASQSHRIPSGYWKIVAIADGATVRVAAFVMDQDTPRSANFCDYRATVNEVEHRSKLDFFSTLPNAEQAALESQPGTLMTDLGCSP